MIGILVQLALSWIIIWFFEKGNLNVLGLVPTKRRLIDLALFFFITAICCATGFLMKMYFAGQQWKLNPELSFTLFFKGLWWNTSSVLFEELIFRGVLLYILIKKTGATKAIIISAIGFGIYHWFSFGIIGNIPQMAIAFITTGVMGLLLAYGYARSLSLYIPIAIHLGWNLTQIFIFSQGPIGNGVFIPVDPAPFRTDSYLLFYSVMYLPMILALSINFFVLKSRKKIQPS